MYFLIQTSLVLTVLCAGALGLFIYTKNRLSYQKLLLVIHFFSIAVWAYATLVVLQLESALAVKITFASAVILAVSKLYFIINFPVQKRPSIYHLFIPLFLSLTIFVVAFFDNTYFLSFTVVDGYYVLIENGPYANLYMIVISCFLIYPIFNLYKKLRSSTYEPAVQQQIKFLLIGVSFFFLLGLITNSILPVLFNVHQFNGIGPSLSLILAGFILYIINKYNFLNLSLILQRGLIYVILLVGISGVYLGLLFFFENINQHHLSINPALSGLLTSIIGIFSVPHIDRYLRKATDRFFFKGTYSYSDTLQLVSEILNPNIEIEKIKTEISKLLIRTLKASEVNFILHSDSPEQETKHDTSDKKYATALKTPLISNGKRIGTLVLSPKQSGESYTPLDIQLVKTISHQLGMAFERALLYKKLQDYSVELEEKIKQRTSELRQAYQDQKDMISNIAHGLQTPLTIIENELVNLQPKQKDSQKLTSLSHSLSSLSTFITDLLKLTHLESANNAELVHHEYFDINELIENIVSYVTVLAAESNSTITYKPNKKTHISGDSKKLEEVLIILISNALKYRSPNKNTNVIIELFSNKESVDINVSDTGAGIPKEDLPKIFDRFYRAKNFSSQVHGSGLGLSIAQAIIKKHHGTLTVKSTVQVGTTFTITIPKHPSKP